MSISKKEATKSRKLPHVKQSAKSTKRMPVFGDDYAVADGDLQQMVEKTLLAQFSVFAARFQLVADLTTNPKAESELAQSSLEQIKQLASESNRSDYRRIMKAIESAVKEGWRGIYRARMTAIRAVHLFFRFEAEYLACLGRYEAKLRASRAEQNL